MTSCRRSVDDVHAVRHHGRVLLSRVLWNGRQLLLLPFEGESDFSVLEARNETELRERIPRRRSCRYHPRWRGVALHDRVRTARPSDRTRASGRRRADRAAAARRLPRRRCPRARQRDDRDGPEVGVSSLVGGRVATLAVDEGDPVRAGDTLAVLDRGEIAAALEAAGGRGRSRDLAMARPRAGTPGIRDRRRPRGTAPPRSLRPSSRSPDFQAHREVCSPASSRPRPSSIAGGARATRPTPRPRPRPISSGWSRPASAATRSRPPRRPPRRPSRSSPARAAGASELLLTAPISGVVLLRNYESGESPSPASRSDARVGPAVGAGLHRRAPPDTRAGSARAPRQVVDRSASSPAAWSRWRARPSSRRARRSPRRSSHLVFGVKIALDPTGGVLKPEAAGGRRHPRTRRASAMSGQDAPGRDAGERRRGASSRSVAWSSALATSSP